jgi:hypothetical protein
VEHLLKVKFVGVLVLPAALVLGLVYLESRVLDPSPPHPRTRGVVWAGRTFVDRAQLARWLRSRGFSYRVWALRHPELSGVKPRPNNARAANATRADRGSTWISAKLAGAVALLALVVLLVVARGRRLIRWLGRTVSAFPRPRTRGVALRRRRGRPALPSAFTLSRARGIVAAVGPRLGPTLSAAAARARRPSLRHGGSVGRMLTAQAAFMAFTFRRKRTQLGWYLATMFLAAGTGLLVAAWLNAA